MIGTKDSLYLIIYLSPSLSSNLFFHSIILFTSLVRSVTLSVSSAPYETFFFQLTTDLSNLSRDNQLAFLILTSWFYFVRTLGKVRPSSGIERGTLSAFEDFLSALVSTSRRKATTVDCFVRLHVCFNSFGPMRPLQITLSVRP